jgi:hypothetical protein
LGLADLYQSVQQAGLQWNSEIFNWINGIGIAPQWFVDWFKTYYLKATVIVAPELNEHVQKYSRAITSGQKVLVVSHSQGNFYVNEAKKLLTAQLTPQQMQSFGIFGVAVPADNVGGSTGPYYTNHRDFILTVPGSLPANWTLKRADGSSADNVGPIDAHLFNPTYISSDFDIKPVLLAGITAQLAALQSSPATGGGCDDYYRKHFISLVAGNYKGVCGKEIVEDFVISSSGLFSAPRTSVDFSDVEAFVTVIQGFANAGGVTTAASHNNTDGSTKDSAASSWDASGKFLIGGVVVPAGGNSSSCDTSGTTPEVPPTYLANKVDITADVAALLASTRSVFPKGTCYDINNGVVSSPGRVTVSFSDSVVTYGDASIDLSANRYLEKVAILPGASANGGKPDYEPQFNYNLTFLDGRQAIFTYKLYSGMTSFAIMKSATSPEFLCLLP